MGFRFRGVAYGSGSFLIMTNLNGGKMLSAN
jgi:hypothetical protein